MTESGPGVVPTFPSVTFRRGPRGTGRVGPPTSTSLGSLHPFPPLTSVYTETSI